MEIFVFGLNHRTAGVALREQFSFSEVKAGHCLKRLLENGVAQEAVILSTCNRTEIYCVSQKTDFGASIRSFLKKHHWACFESFEKCFYLFRGPGAIRHLFRVASSLDSMVIGETEILGQVKKAYQSACGQNMTGPLLNMLFQRSFYVAKLLQAQTRIHEGFVSVSSIAVQLAEEILGDLSSKTILVMGAGKMSERTLQKLAKKGVKEIIASNRNHEKAKSLARQYGGRTILLTELQSIVHQIDLMISSTSAPHYILYRQDVERMMEKRHGRPLLIIDIAVPRDVDPNVADLEDVHLLNIDHFNELSQKNLKNRFQECQKAEWIVEEEVLRFVQDYQGRRDFNKRKDLLMEMEFR